MKKNAMLKIAAVLLVAVLLTTCFISSTFAKYVTDGGKAATNTGRVAKWGLAITGLYDNSTVNDNLKPLFKTSYTNNNSETIAASANGTDFIVAPGTSNNTALGFAIQGSPEVAFKVSVKPTVALSDNWKGSDRNTFYCPVKFWIGTKTGDGIKPENAQATNIEAAIAQYILGADADVKLSTEDNATYYAEYAPNADQFAAEEGKSVTIYWEWDFEDGDDATDKNDTALGNANGPLTIAISYEVSAEQINGFTA